VDMKRIVAALFVLFVAVQASAQQYQHVLINRQDDQKAVVYHATLVASAKSFSIDLKATRASLISDQDVIIEGTIHNTSSGSLPIDFHRTHIRLPEDWTASICFGTTCYAPIADSVPPQFSFSIDDSTAEFLLHITGTGNGPDSLVDYIKFVALTGDPSDTIGVLFTGVLSQNAGVNQGQASTQVQSKILSLYPSPLIDGNAIRVKVSSPKVQSFSYSISDELGRGVAFGTTHQQLIQGDNTCSIGELAGLTNGTYLLKFTFGDGSVDTRTFQIAH
jgi:hypothetical protein